MAWVIFGAAFLVGFLVGRWWAIAAAVPVGVWAWHSSVPHFGEDEAGIPGLLGLLSGGATAVAIAVGILARITVRAVTQPRG